MRIRVYRSGDAAAGRHLYTELVQHHREIYDDLGIGGTDPGAGFDAYLARPDRVCTWVAEDPAEKVVGLAGLLWSDNEAEVEPVVVTRDRRGEGIGRALIDEAIAEARRLGAHDLNIRPVARNAAAIRAFHAAGFRTVGHVQLFMRLSEDPGSWREGIELHGRDFTH